MHKHQLTAEMISVVPCPLCGSPACVKMFDTFDHEYNTTDISFPLVECTDCGAKYLSPRPNLKSLDIIYPDTYNNFSTSDSADQSYVRKISNSIQTSRIKSLLKKYHPEAGTRPLNILDVGCGDGNILDRVKEAFPDANTFGIEPNSKAAALAAKRHEIFEGVFEDYRTDLNFDLIFSSHVVEHVELPINFLKNIRLALKDDGVAIIDTPNIDCLQFEIFSKHWGGLHSPRHWTLFDKKTLGDSAKKAGFNIMEIIEMPINTFWVWSLHAYLYSKNKKKFADKYFSVTDCVSKKSIYYLFVMIGAEFLERITGLFGLGLGQQRMVLKK